MDLQVVHIIDHLGVGGAQRFLHDLVLVQQRNARVRPSVVCLTQRTDLSTQFERADIPLWHLGAGRRRPLQMLILLPRLCRLLRQMRPDIVHTHLFASGLFGRIAAFLRGVPTVVHEQCNESTSASWFAKQIDSLLARGTSAVICVSQTTAEFNQKAKKVSSEKIHVIPNSINPKRFRDAPVASHSRFKESLALQEDALVVTGIGRLVRQKRFDLLLQVASVVLKARKNVSFLIVGSGPERKRLEDSAKAKGIDNHVHFLGTRTDIDSILGVTDVFLLMSDFEGLPLTLLESMAMGVCVVATDVDGIHEVLAGTDAGILVPSGDPLPASEALLSLLNNRERRLKMAAAGPEIVAKRYDIAIAASQVEAIYRNILK